MMTEPKILILPKIWHLQKKTEDSTFLIFPGSTFFPYVADWSQVQEIVRGTTLSYQC